MNGALIKSVNYENMTQFPSIPGSNSVSESALILGQESDRIGGDFSKKQLFQGSLTEVNIWGRLLSSQEIQDLAECRNFPKGNLISWTVENYITNEIEFEKFDSLEDLCNREVWFMFPEKRTMTEAIAICTELGGNIVEPRSKDCLLYTSDAADE